MPSEAAANLPHCATFCRAVSAQCPAPGLGSPAPRSHRIPLSMPKSSSSSCNPAAPGCTLQPRKTKEFAPSRDGAMRKHGSRSTFPAKPPAEFQPVGFKKDQSLAEVLDKPSFTWGKTFLTLETAWTTQHNRDACRCTSKEGAAPRVHFGKHFHIEFKHLEKRLYALST